MRRGRHPADAAHAAGVRPQLLFHLDVHGRPSGLACGETEKGIGNDAQPPRIRSTCGGDGRLAGVERPRAGLAHQWPERRDLYPEGVASGDPDPNSVILWTRRPFADAGAAMCSPSRSPRTKAFAASSPMRRRRFPPRPTGPAACWSAALSRRTSIGIASPTPTGTAAASAAPSPRPLPDDPRPVNFAFVSCQDVNEGKLNAYRRMIFEDERAAPADQLGFVLHLGDFIYEVVAISRRSEDPLRPDHLRGRAHPGRRQGRPFPFPADGRRLSRRLQRLSRRPRPAGRARALAVRRASGTITNSPGRAGRASSKPAASAAGPDASRSPPTRPGSGISPVALQEVWPSGSWEHFEAARGQECRNQEVGRKRPWR